MAAIKKRGKKWQVQIFKNGVRKSATFDTKSAAMQWSLDEENKIQSAKDGKNLNLTVTDILTRYKETVSPTKRGERFEILRINKILTDPIAEVKLFDLRAFHVAEWRNQRLKEVSPSSVAREMTIIKHAFEIARKEWHWLESNPANDVAKPKTPPPRDRRITDEEIEQVLAALGFYEEEVTTKQHEVAIAFLFAIETAMRAGEILSLDSSCINGRVAHLKQTKNGTARKVPLSPRALELFGLLPEGRFTITSKVLDATFRKARDKTLIKDLHFHDTRHEAITRLAKKLEVLDLARMTGHKDLKQLMIYYNATAEDLADKLG